MGESQVSLGGRMGTVALPQQGLGAARAPCLVLSQVLWQHSLENVSKVDLSPRQPNNLSSKMKPKKDCAPTLWNNMKIVGHGILHQFPMKCTSADKGGPRRGVASTCVCSLGSSAPGII